MKPVYHASRYRNPLDLGGNRHGERGDNKPNSSKLWHLKYRFGGKEKKLAFGAYPTVSLATARKLREEARAVLSVSNTDIRP